MANAVREFETNDRTKFAAILRAVRGDRTLRVYGREFPWGRVIIADQFRLRYAAGAYGKPRLNIHR